MRSPILFGAMSKEINTFVSEIIGDVAQLARALDWQSRGRGFESLLLHNLLNLFPMKGISGFGYLIWAIVIVDILCQIYEYYSY